jgi:hypothetical protein
MQRALDEDLAVLRARNPRASQADVVRSWARSSDRRRAVEHNALVHEELQALRAALEDAQDRAARAEALLAGYEDRMTRAQLRDVEAAHRVLAANPDIVRHVQDLVKLEAAGLVAASSYPLLQRARRGVTSWQDLLPRRDAP